LNLRGSSILFDPFAERGYTFVGRRNMVKALKKTWQPVERKPERAKVTREEFLENIKRADEWRKKRLAQIKKSAR
jgi:hypothetical protein